MNYAKIMENGTVRISSIKKEGYKPLKEEKPEGFGNLVFVGYTETEENVIKEYEAVDDGMSAIRISGQEFHGRRYLRISGKGRDKRTKCTDSGADCTAIAVRFLRRWKE